jgi:hypothetical protein
MPAAVDVTRVLPYAYSRAGRQDHEPKRHGTVSNTLVTRVGAEHATHAKATDGSRSPVVLSAGMTERDGEKAASLWVT